MTVVIPKARMGPVERCATVFGLVVAGVAVGAAAALSSGLAWLALLGGAGAGLGLALVPGRRLEYRLDAESLQAGGMKLPYSDIVSVKLVRLRGVVVYRGLTLPGFWSGWAWAPHLGRFQLRGSVGLGQGVMITLSGGRQVMITPEDSLELVVRLQIYLHKVRRGS